jgi:delta1-piperideine-2-carboxylate reductase
MAEHVRLRLDEVHGLAYEVLRHNGLSEAQAGAIAATVTAAERDECLSHGLFRIPGYVQSVRSGKGTPDAVPEIRDLAPGVVQVNAHNGFAPLALQVGREPLAEKARRQGIAALAIINSYHFAALWPEVEVLAEMGLVAFAFTCSRSFVAPAGGNKPLYGTNPMAFAWPRSGRPPLVFDQASSASARGEIQLHQRDAKPLPEGWAIDAEGHPTTDAGAALAGAQLPFGGYKGASIALMVELLAAALIGDRFAFEAAAIDNNDGGPATGGELIMALAPTRFVGAQDSAAQLAHAEQLFDRILQQDGARLPSDRRYAARQRTTREGVWVARTLYETIRQLHV